MYKLIKDKKIEILLFVIAVLFLLFYSANTSPLYPGFHGWDSAFFMLVGKMIHGGKLPYVDIMDSKGPILYWIYAIGDCISGDRAGIWIIQLIFFCISLYFTYRIVCLFLSSNKKALIIVCQGVIVWMATFENGGLTEELSLPFLISGCYLLVRYLTGKIQKHSPGNAFWYGICFAVMLFIRVTNAAMLCGLVASVAFLLVIKKEWKNLFCNVICFLIGFTLVTGPIIYYFWSRGALGDFWLGMFQLAGNYAGYGNTGIQMEAMLVWLGKNALLLFSMGSALWYAKKVNAQCGWSVLFADTVLLLVLTLGNGYLHYFTLVVPAFLIGAAMLSEILGGCSFSNLRRCFHSHKVCSIIIGVFALTAVVYYGKYVILTTGGNMLKAVTRYYDSTREALREQTELIPREESDSVLAYNIRPRWYVIGGLEPYYRLGAYQENFTRLVPALRQEQEEKFREEPPLWVAVELENLDCPQLEKMLQQDYKLIDQSEGISLYRRTE